MASIGRTKSTPTGYRNSEQIWNETSICDGIGRADGVEGAEKSSGGLGEGIPRRLGDGVGFEGASELRVAGYGLAVGGVQAALRYSLMSPPQVVCRRIGWPFPVAAMWWLSLGARCPRLRCGRCSW